MTRSRTQVVLALLAVLVCTACGSTVPLSARAGAAEPAGGQDLATGQDGPAGETAVTTPLGGDGSATRSGGVPAAAASSGVSAVETRAGGAAAGRALAEKGPGWDAKTIYVGVATQQTIAAVGHSIGNDALDYGDQAAQWRAVFAYVNKNGGLFGRRLEPVYYDNDLTQTQSTNATAACAKWTQDRRVAVALALIPGLGEGMVKCFRDNKLPAVATSFTPILARDLTPYVPYTVVTQNADFARLTDPWLDALKAKGYFTGWNTSTGEPGPAPVRLGLLYQDRPSIARAYAYLAKRLKERGLASDVVTVAYADVPDSGAVVKFRSNNVTHVFVDNLAGLLFPQVAESQSYRPRYAVSSLNLLYPFMQQNAPKQQLRGMLGVGWMPTADVGEAQDPGSNAAAKVCRQMQAESGSPTRTRNEKYVVYSDCDAVRLYLAAALRGGGLAAEQVVSGLVSTSPTFESALSFGLGAPLPLLVDRVRALGWDTTCSCVRYLPGADYRLP